MVGCVDVGGGVGWGPWMWVGGLDGGGGVEGVVLVGHVWMMLQWWGWCGEGWHVYMWFLYRCVLHASPSYSITR